MSATKKKLCVRPIGCIILTIALTTIASVGRCDPIDELVGNSFSQQLHWRDFRGQWTATVTVRIGTKLQKEGNYYTVPYKLLLDGSPLIDLPTEYIDTGKISGSGDSYKFTVKESRLKMTIGGDPKNCNDFKTDGTFYATGERQATIEEGANGLFNPKADIYFKGPWKK